MGSKLQLGKGRVGGPATRGHQHQQCYRCSEKKRITKNCITVSKMPRECKKQCQTRVQEPCMLVKPPSKETMYKAVMCYLIRQNIAAIHREVCPGCGPEPQPNQLAHIGFGDGCLDPLQKVDDVMFSKASVDLSPMAMNDLYYSIVSVLKIPEHQKSLSPTRSWPNR